MSTSPSPDISLLGKIAEYTEIIARDPQSSAFVPLADAYRRLGMLDEAREVAEQGVKTLPRHAPGFVVLGRICLEQKDLDGAGNVLEKALELDAANLSALHGLVRVLLAKGEKERAGELLQHGIRLHPQDAGLRQMLDTFIPNDRKGMPTAGTPRKAPIATPTIAELYLKQGFPARALKVYRDLLAANPADEGLRRKVRELEAMRAGDAPRGTDIATAIPLDRPATPPLPAEAESSESRYLQLLDRWLVAVRERKADVR